MLKGLANEGQRIAELAQTIRTALETTLRAEIAEARAQAVAALVPTTVLHQWDLVTNSFCVQAACGQYFLSVELPGLDVSDVEPLRSLLSVGGHFRNVAITPRCEGAGYELALFW